MISLCTTLALSSAPPELDERYRTVVAADEPDAFAEQRAADRRTPGFVTVVDLTRPDGARPSDGLAEVLARAPGTTVRSLGGLGQFGSVSLRGSSAQQVQIALDGVPIGSALAGLVDVGSLPLDGTDRIEIHRGFAPVEYGSAAIGGVVDLVGTVADDVTTVRAAAGMGSFGARTASIGVQVPVARGVSVAPWVGYGGATGAFPFHDTAGTPQIPDDDGTRRRANNHYDRVFAQTRVDVRRRGWRVGVRPMGGFKQQGIPGPGSAQTRSSALSTADGRLLLRAVRNDLGRPGSQLAWVAGVGVQQRRFSDPRNEIGLAVDDEWTTALDTWVSPRLRLALWRGAWVRIVADQRTELVRVSERSVASPDALETSGDATRTRTGLGLGVQLDQHLFARRWLLAPVLRVDVLDSRFAVRPGEGEQDDQGRDAVTIATSPRLGTRLRLVGGLEARASAGRYFRAPTLLELFGDRGWAIGNEGLRPERGTTVDAGLVLDRGLGTRGRGRLYAHAAGFSIWARDLVQWIQAAQVVRPVNIEGARLTGLETGLSLHAPWRIVTATANYTLLSSRNLGPDPEQRGAPLPGRPRHEAYASVSTGHEWHPGGLPIEPRGFYRLDLASRTFLDPSGRVEVPTRILHGVGAELFADRRIHFAFEVRNVLDTRVTTWSPPIEGVGPLPVPLSDFIGYPLPGRSFFATLAIDVGLGVRREERS
jgi:iron complex outermembrane receptor protein